jgi:hypothetical protein
MAIRTEDDVLAALRPRVWDNSHNSELFRKKGIQPLKAWAAECPLSGENGQCSEITPVMKRRGGSVHRA